MVVDAIRDGDSLILVYDFSTRIFSGEPELMMTGRLEWLIFIHVIHVQHSKLVLAVSKC